MKKDEGLYPRLFLNRLNVDICRKNKVNFFVFLTERIVLWLIFEIKTL